MIRQNDFATIKSDVSEICQLVTEKLTCALQSQAHEGGGCGGAVESHGEFCHKTFRSWLRVAVFFVSAAANRRDVPLIHVTHEANRQTYSNLVWGLTAFWKYLFNRNTYKRIYLTIIVELAINLRLVNSSKLRPTLVFGSLRERIFLFSLQDEKKRTTPKPTSIGMPPFSSSWRWTQIDWGERHTLAAMSSDPFGMCWRSLWKRTKTTTK